MMLLSLASFFQRERNGEQFFAREALPKWYIKTELSDLVRVWVRARLYFWRWDGHEKQCSLLRGSSQLFCCSFCTMCPPATEDPEGILSNSQWSLLPGKFRQDCSLSFFEIAI